ncbi:Nitrosoguanidine resistance protein SNG1 [Spathaspora sp. JA1]|nr:Nitrosoguanidine resistance protein SNG1 [Spathaspora sp. JA1]
MRDSVASDIITDEEGSSHEEPMGYYPSTRTSSGRSPSLGRRLSNAVDSYFTIPESDGDSYEEPLPLDDDEYLADNFFGTRQLTNSLTHRRTNKDIESLITQDEEESPEEFPQLYHGVTEQTLQPQDIEKLPLPPLERRRSTVVTAIQNVTKKFNFWDKEYHADRIHIALKFLDNYLYLVVGFTAALCIYWGSYFDRTAHYTRLKFAVIIADAPVGNLPNILGQTVEAFFTKVPAIQQLGNFDIWDFDRINTLAQSHNNTITQEVYRQVHHQKYWAAFYVHPNATLQWAQALAQASTAFDPSTSLMEVVYETGRDFNAVMNSIITVIQTIVRGWYSFLPNTNLVSNMLQTINSTETTTVISQSPQLLTTMPTFFVNDRIPVTNLVFQAPFQIGLIYIVIFTFFQFIFSIKIHMYIASKIKGFQYVMYRMISAQIAYLILSLAYVVLNTAFGLKFNKAFGQAGFLVIWMFAFLTMASLGSIIELIVLFLVAIKPVLIGFLLLFVAVTNLSPVISPIVLCPTFYRYGYAMPVRNSYELMHVAYFDSWKGHMGRNIGILVTWIVVSNAAMPFVMKWLAKKKAQLDAKAAAEKVNKE